MNETTSSNNQVETIVSSARSRPRWGRILAWTGLVVLLVILAFSLVRSGQGSVKESQHAPNFTLSTFDGQKITLDTLKGKVVVVNFWASWCKPCEQEAADLEAAWQYYKERGNIIFLGVDWTDTESNGKVYLKKFDITYPNGPDLGTRISQAYRITGVPETYIIDQNGILAYSKYSPFTSLEEIKSTIDPLLSSQLYP
jgi:cytochrome c biogenesis protein CcmG/thiol:disulfide interchange protein DsbE